MKADPAALDRVNPALGDPLGTWTSVASISVSAARFSNNSEIIDLSSAPPSRGRQLVSSDCFLRRPNIEVVDCGDRLLAKVTDFFRDLPNLAISFLSLRPSAKAFPDLIPRI